MKPPTKQIEVLDDVACGQIIAQLRANAKISKARAVKLLGLVDAGHLDAYERGEISFTAERFEQMAELLS